MREYLFAYLYFYSEGMKQLSSKHKPYPNILLRFSAEQNLWIYGLVFSSFFFLIFFLNSVLIFLNIQSCSYFKPVLNNPKAIKLKTVIVQMIYSNMLYASNILTSYFVLRTNKLLERTAFYYQKQRHELLMKTYTTATHTDISLR